MVIANCALSHNRDTEPRKDEGTSRKGNRRTTADVIPSITTSKGNVWGPGGSSTSGAKSRCCLLCPINTRGLCAGSRRPRCAQGSAFCQGLKAQDFGMFSIPRIRMTGHRR